MKPNAMLSCTLLVPSTIEKLQGIFKREISWSNFCFFLYLLVNLVYSTEELCLVMCLLILAVFHYPLQFYSLPSQLLLSFSVFFFTRLSFQNCQSSNITAPRQPPKGLRLFLLTLQLVASRHYPKEYVPFFINTCFAKTKGYSHFIIQR